MGDEESNYKVEYLDLPEDSTEEKEFVWVARAGKARVTYNSGSVYEGDFNDEKMKHGTGKFVWMTQGEEDEEPKPLATYEGAYADGKRSGVGTMTYPSGDTYTGEWKDNKMHGTGTYKYKKTDDIYSGSFVDGEKEGACIGRARKRHGAFEAERPEAGSSAPSGEKPAAHTDRS